MSTIEEMLYLFRGELTYSEILNMTYKEISYLKDLRQKREKANGGADRMAAALASAFTGGHV